MPNRTIRCRATCAQPVGIQLYVVYMSRSTGVHTCDELYNQLWTYTGAHTRLHLLVFHPYTLTFFHRLARRNVLASLVARRGAYMHAWHYSVLASLLIT